jgi:hypothetical protein
VKAESWRLATYFKTGVILSSWEKENRTVVLMGWLVMRFVNVKDLGEALSDAEHCLVYVQLFTSDRKCITPSQGSHHSVNIRTVL